MKKEKKGKNTILPSLHDKTGVGGSECGYHAEGMDNSATLADVKSSKPLN